MTSALEGIRVLDWTIFQAGPVASEMLGDLGAEVIKIEQRDVGDPGRGFITTNGLRASLAGGRNYYFETCNRNKKSISLDLGKPRAKEVVYRLVAKSDVFVHNFRKGAAERQGLGYETLRNLNPKLIYAWATGYGEEGPESDRPAFDPVALYRSGFARENARPGQEPHYPPGGIADQLNGWSLAYGVLAALMARERSGTGQKVTSSFLSSMMWLQALSMGAYLYMGHSLPLVERERFANPLFNYYRCADDRWLFVVLIQPERHWPDFCRAMSITHLLDDPRFADLTSRRQHRKPLIDILDELFAAKTAAEWTAIFGQYPDFVYATAQSLADLAGDPQVVANNYLLDFDHPVLGKVRMVAPPVALSETPAGVQRPAPEHGEHTEEVLIDVCGYTWNEVVALRDEAVI